MPPLSDGWVLYLSQIATWIGLLWTVVNSVRTRDHANSLEVLKKDLRREVELELLAEGSRLRVAAEIRLELHSEAWSLLREIQAAAFAAHEQTRRYAAHTVLFSKNGNPTQREERSKAYEAATAAISQLSGLCLCAPPKHGRLQDAAKQFVNAFNMVNAFRDEANPPEDDLLSAVVSILEGALDTAGAAIMNWNAEIWREHDTEASVERAA